MSACKGFLMLKFLKSILRIILYILLVLIFMWILLARPSFIMKGSYQPNIVVSPDSLRKHVKVLSKDLIPRDYLHIENLNKVASYITNQLKLTNNNVYEQKFQAIDGEYKNIIAEYGPDSSEIIVVGAHYDAEGEKPGADDNASAISGLLELGSLLSQTELNSRVMLVAYTLEEPPYFGTILMGSAIHAKSLKEKNISIKLMICLEMIGYFSEEKGSQSYPIPLLKLLYPSEGNFILIVDRIFSNHSYHFKNHMKKITDLSTYSINAPVYIPGIDFSDHRNYWKYNYPAIMITDTAFYRNKAYHTKDDTFDRLDYSKMAQIVYGVFNYIKLLANE